jgi:hypothetical protein
MHSRAIPFEGAVTLVTSQEEYLSVFKVFDGSATRVRGERPRLMNQPSNLDLDQIDHLQIAFDVPS